MERVLRCPYCGHLSAADDPVEPREEPAAELGTVYVLACRDIRACARRLTEWQAGQRANGEAAREAMRTA